MDTKHQILREKKDEKLKNEGKRDVPLSKQKAQQVQLNKNPQISSPPSSSSSPSHEFSFTISLQPSKIPDKNTKSTPSFAIDLSPADEIFFHGHLLPLHLLSHLPVSPRTSTNSLDSFTLPIKDSLLDHNNNNNNNNNSNNDMERSNECKNIEEIDVLQGKGRGKSKSFSLFGMQKWRKGCESKENNRNQQETEQKQRKYSKIDVGHVVRRYMKLVKPFLFFKSNRANHHHHHHHHHDHQFERQPYSFSGNLLVKGKRALGGRRGGFTAPASMNNSPTNSGLLVASGSTTPTTKSDSTMEELQAAIQAAIAHCKKSINAENEINMP